MIGFAKLFLIIGLASVLAGTYFYRTGSGRPARSPAMAREYDNDVKRIAWLLILSGAAAGATGAAVLFVAG